MKLSLMVEADTANILALNMGRIAVDIDGVELANLIDVVNQNGYSLRVADAPGKLIVEDPLPPVAHLNGIQCSTAHITEADNTLLYTLSHQNWRQQVDSVHRLGLSAPPGRVVISGLTPQTSGSVERLSQVSRNADTSLRRWYCSAGCLW